MLASISGAFLAHVGLLFFVMVLPRADSAVLENGQRAPSPSVQEVTVMMGELMERLERERRVEPPEPEAPRPAARPFISTDANVAEAEAPANASYESDRNTRAASRLRPDESLPQQDAPTLAGNNPLPHLSLANRDYVEGPLGQEASGVAPTAAAAPRPSTRPSPAPAKAADPPAAASSGAGAQAATAPTAETGTALQAKERESYALKAEEGQKVAKGEDGDVEPALGDALPSNGPGESPADSPVADAPPGETAEDRAAAESDQPPSPSSADEGLFAKGFQAEERQNFINGKYRRAGADAVDAEATPLGRYKKAVRDAISERWHRYRQDNADFVTWGMLKVEFTVDAAGRIRGLEITKNEANSMLAEFSLRAIRDAKLPAMPPEVAESIGESGLVIQYDIIIY